MAQSDWGFQTQTVPYNLIHLSEADCHSPCQDVAFQEVIFITHRPADEVLRGNLLCRARLNLLASDLIGPDIVPPSIATLHVGGVIARALALVRSHRRQRERVDLGRLRLWCMDRTVA